MYITVFTVQTHLFSICVTTLIYVSHTTFACPDKISKLNKWCSLFVNLVGNQYDRKDMECDLPLSLHIQSIDKMAAPLVCAEAAHSFVQNKYQLKEVAFLCLRKQIRKIFMLKIDQTNNVIKFKCFKM